MNAAATPETARYFAQYEFDTDDAAKSVLSLLELAQKAFADGRHIDCIDGSVSAPGAIWAEIDPESLEPLDEAEMDYPRNPPEHLDAAIKSMKAALK